MDQTFQRQRFELKYRINEVKAQEIRFFVENYLECDPYGASQPNRSYAIYSLYLDSPGLNTYHRTVNGDRNRFKLRLRYYNSDESPVFFEIKQRNNRVIRKKRAQVYRTAVQDLLNGHVPTKSHLVVKSSTQMDALEHFCMLSGELRATPKMLISYFREAYESEDTNDVRLTMDRNIRACRVHQNRIPAYLDNEFSVFGNMVILELKFTNRFPDWLRELTQRFHLRHESASKYVDSIERLRFNNIENGINFTPVYHE
ncbi:polyphosphate polymerase domain-containing protein [Rhodohalobacter sp. 614A]|uniref:polyphosphate polymerase domain-containing protein n=1 Tax=Rhodohalobacter sp. 614A TaxID=2908649 RepID=UPI001F1AB6CF|nr:polyphosphate polymerase domain-containing protein [Rhodohalobacter sp. 614A]